MAHFDAEGDGRAVVFLHAAVGDRRMWHPQWRHFSPTNRVVRIDQRGFGANPPIDTPFDPAQDTIDVLDGLDISQAVVVGASMGGRLALEIAVRRPDLVAGLVLLCAALPGHEWSSEVQDVWRRESAALDNGDLETATDVNVRFWLDGPNRERAQVSDADRALVADMQHQALAYELAHPDAAPQPPLAELATRISEIAVPTHVAYGTHDAADIEAIARSITDRIQHAALHRIDGAAHLPSLERPQEVNAIVQALISRLDTGMEAS